MAPEITGKSAPSPHFSPGFGISGHSSKADWPFARRRIAVAMGQGGIGQDAKPEWAKNRIGQPVDPATGRKEAKALFPETDSWNPGPPGEKCGLEGFFSTLQSTMADQMKLAGVQAAVPKHM